MGKKNQPRKVMVINKKTGNTVIYNSAAAASRVLTGTGSPNAAGTITKYCRKGGGVYRNHTVKWV